MSDLIKKALGCCNDVQAGQAARHALAWKKSGTQGQELGTSSGRCCSVKLRMASQVPFGATLTFSPPHLIYHISSPCTKAT